ncbi:hypothetical protein FVW20_05010 [Desulfovibrio oxamicus]|uniref:Uncharacterized protein n=1 Tax=Nitratidesulfovibrio oxamicus TaxID=32016 RepID=A0ABS0J2L9_9BACT|nr:hypothetical protein [Nitratidesulfovibrio oxamicus]MBG3876402.1 hypothetical protein [Nitratidesulfovibrio oxamicus]
MDSFALKAFTSHAGSCDPEDAIHLPQLLPPNGQTRKLSILVNSSGRYTSMQIHGMKKIPCSNVSHGARIAYDKQCVADLSDIPPGTTDILITLDDDFREETTRLKVMIPPPGL